MRDSEIVVHKGGGSSWVGPDAIKLMKAITLRGELKLFRETGIRPTRGVGPTQMLLLAGEFSGKADKRGQLQQAEADVHKWIETMRAAIPTTIEGVQQ